MDNLKEDLKTQIIEQLNLEDIQPSDIGEDTLLFSSQGLGLDSIDALELIVMLDKYHDVQVINPDDGKEAFVSVAAMAAYIQKRKAE